MSAKKRVEAKRQVLNVRFRWQIFLWFYNGPVNAIIVNSVDHQLRTRAMSVSILAIHIFGDAASPAIVGIISETSGLEAAMAIVPVTLALGAFIWLYGWRTLPERRTGSADGWTGEDTSLDSAASSADSELDELHAS